MDDIWKDLKKRIFQLQVEIRQRSFFVYKVFNNITFRVVIFTSPKDIVTIEKKGKRKVQGVPQSQTAALPRHQEEEETDKSKQAQIEQTYEKH